jgi:hypothetical protein
VQGLAFTHASKAVCLFRLILFCLSSIPFRFVLT